jgi:hypothetical protein
MQDEEGSEPEENQENSDNKEPAKSRKLDFQPNINRFILQAYKIPNKKGPVAASQAQMEIIAREACKGVTQWQETYRGKSVFKMEDLARIVTQYMNKKEWRTDVEKACNSKNFDHPSLRDLGISLCDQINDC